MEELGPDILAIKNEKFKLDHTMCIYLADEAANLGGMKKSPTHNLPLSKFELLLRLFCLL